jgi:CheY-like chemotaxis protein
MMPEMNGFQFIETFEKLPCKIQEKYFVVALTSSMNRADLARLSNYQSIHFVLDKPITVVKLNMVIGKATSDFTKKA